MEGNGLGRQASDTMTQFRALLLKNKLIIMVNKGYTITEFLLPLILALVILAVSFLFTDNSLTYDRFLQDIVMRSYFPLLCGKCSNFILHQAVKERELNILTSLIVMNLRSRAYGASYLVIEQPLCLWTGICVCISFLKLLNYNSVDLFIIFALTILMCETLIIFALCLSTLFHRAKRASQVGFMILFLALVPYQIILTAMDTDFDRYGWVFYLFCWLPPIP
jgi:hypothetical protein